VKSLACQQVYMGRVDIDISAAAQSLGPMLVTENPDDACFSFLRYRRHAA
jgi:hypothetical protein